MELRIAIFDDLANERARLIRDLMTLSLPGQKVNISLSDYTSAEEFLETFKKGSVKLVFLDICMDGMNGIELATRLRQEDPQLLIVFLTTSREFAFEAFPVHPFDYLIKPYDSRKLHDLMAEVLRILSTDDPTVTLKIPRDTLEVPLRNLAAVESKGHSTIVRLVDGSSIKCTMGFNAVSDLLTDDPRFLPCNRGIVVNMDEVKKLGGDDLVMKDGTVYPLRVRNRSALVTQFSQYMISRMRGGGQ